MIGSTGSRRDNDTTAQLELRALEKMVSALCRHTELLCRQALEADALTTREAELQRRAFDERRREAVALMRAPGTEPVAMRIARLERLVEALEVSRAYFIELAGSR